MRLFLQINILDWKDQAYDKPLLSYASSLADDIIGTDLDSESDPYVANLVMQLATQATAIFILVVGKPSLPLGTANTLINFLLKNKEKVSNALLWGDHELAGKLLRPFGAKFQQAGSDDEIRKLIALFATGESD